MGGVLQWSASRGGSQILQMCVINGCMMWGVAVAKVGCCTDDGPFIKW